MPAIDVTKLCKVVSISQSLIQIEVMDPTELKKTSEQPLTIGTYLKIADEDDLAVIAVVQGYRIKDPVDPNADTDSRGSTFVLDAQPLGYIDSENRFQRGGQQIAIPPTSVAIADQETLKKIYSTDEPEGSLCIGRLAHDESIEVPINGDVFFGKHIAVVGSTGSGKSCTVAKIIQEGRRQTAGQESASKLNNSHIIIFDLHGEYAPAFPDARLLGIDELRVPYWLMTAEELEELFIESNEQNSHNQVSQFRYAVQANKRKHNDESHVSYDSPVYFSIEQVYNYIWNMNNEVIASWEKDEKKGFPKLANGTIVENREEHYFEEKREFVPRSATAKEKAVNGPFAGDFDRFVLRLRNTLDSERLSFLFKPEKASGEPFKTGDMQDLIEAIIGYGEDTRNVTIIDLHGVPFEVHSLVVSLLSRIIFQVGFYRKRIASAKGKTDKKKHEIAFLVVYEEAHNYVPGSPLVKFRSVTRSIERIAKEGRKYGISLMIVSQRPSEISETVFSQCSSFIAMRLTNPTDQNYVKRLLPDAAGGLTDALPILAQREALLLGECIPIPTLLRIAEITDKPHSDDIRVMQEWRKDWADLPFDQLLGEIKQC